MNNDFTKTRESQQTAVQQYQEAITAGKALYAPFKLRYSKDKRETERQRDWKAYYFDCLSIRVCLELNQDVRPLYIEVRNAWNGMTQSDLANWMKEAAESEDLFHSLCEISKRNERNESIVNLIKAISEFVKYGYNRRVDIEDENLKIFASKPESSLLMLAIVCTTLSSYLGIDPVQLDRERLGPMYDYLQIASKASGSYKSPNRRARRQIEKAKKFGLNLIHEDVALELLRLWYKSRVLYDSLAEAASEYKLTANDLSKKLSESGIDAATGYRALDDT